MFCGCQMVTITIVRLSLLLYNVFMKLSEWAMREGIAAYTARRLNEDAFPVPVYRTPGGHWRMDEPGYEGPSINPKRMVSYTRLYLLNQKKDIQR